MPETRTEDERVTAATQDALTEARRARSLGFAPARSAHEGYAIIHEEFDELKEHVWMNQKKRDIPAMRSEAIQVAAMAIRFAAECDIEGWGRI